ncbi:Venom phospholipase A1 [Cyphomyrmex costatus]|uniref:phospholipase A1 n=1 Tax=Cyphomyrmex costatus TaxID=456900 RepID=A0A195C653_9HYME|nr:Venom phospholipase A1 [Cyphomyrmex costatus]
MIPENEICNNINSSQPVTFVTHGFTSSAHSSYTIDLAMQLKHKSTVFVLDWSQAACETGLPLINLIFYPSAVTNTREIGQLLANYANTVIKQCDVPLEKITFIGHSLGAHVVGFAAKILQKFGYIIPLIIAADPARPLFSRNDCEERLCKDDANRVIAIHTSELGISFPVGHFDLYFNGGEKQPGCGIDFISCPHRRAVIYLTTVLEKSCGFLGISDNLSSYPDSNTTDCIVVNSNLLDHKNSMNGSYYVFVDEDSHCTEQTFNCKQIRKFARSLIAINLLSISDPAEMSLVCGGAVVFGCGLFNCPVVEGAAKPGGGCIAQC